MRCVEHNVILIVDKTAWKMTEHTSLQGWS